MKVLRLLMLFQVVTLIAASLAGAGQASDCVNLVEKGIAMFKDNGRKATIKAISDPKGPFVKDDLYVFALTMDNVMVAHPYQKLLRRMNMSKTQDGNGEYFFVKFKKVAQDPGYGWVEYTWAKPGKKNASKKKSFIKKVPGEDLYIGAGYYLE